MRISQTLPPDMVTAYHLVARRRADREPGADRVTGPLGSVAPRARRVESAGALPPPLTHRARSLDALVRPRENRVGDREAEGLRGPQIDDALELGGLLDGQVGGARALQDPDRHPLAGGLRPDHEWPSKQSEDEAGLRDQRPTIRGHQPHQPATNPPRAVYEVYRARGDGENRLKEPWPGVGPAASGLRPRIQNRQSSQSCCR